MARRYGAGQALADVFKALPLKGFPVFGDFNPFFYGNPFNMQMINIQAVWKQLEAAKR